VRDHDQNKCKQQRKNKDTKQQAQYNENTGKKKGKSNSDSVRKKINELTVYKK